MSDDMNLNEVHRAMNQEGDGKMPEPQPDYRTKLDPGKPSGEMFSDRPKSSIEPMKPEPIQPMIQCPYAAEKTTKEGNATICNLRNCPYGNAQITNHFNFEPMTICKTDGMIEPQGLGSLVTKTEE